MKVASKYHVVGLM